MNHAGVKPPSNTRRVMFRDVPNGTVVWHEGYWGVVVRGGPAVSRAPDFLDRWDAPPIRFKHSAEQVSVPYPQRKT